MVEPAIYAALGFLLATLLWLLFIPAFWRRAVRLTTKRMLGRLPISATEIVAGQDRLRAEYAMSMRAIERRAEQALTEAAAERVEAGRARGTELGHIASLTETRERVAALETDKEQLTGDIATAVAAAAAANEAKTAAEEARVAAAEELAAAREDASAARLSLDQARIETSAREGEIASLRAEIEGLKDRLGSAGVAAVAAPISEGDQLKALRARLDEVADAIVKAAAPEDASPPAAKPAAKMPSADPDLEVVRFITREPANAH